VPAHAACHRERSDVLAAVGVAFKAMVTPAAAIQERMESIFKPW